MVSRNADTTIPEISSDRYCLSFSFYEQLKLPFLTDLTESIVLSEKIMAS